MLHNRIADCALRKRPTRPMVTPSPVQPRKHHIAHPRLKIPPYSRQATCHQASAPPSSHQLPLSVSLEAQPCLREHAELYEHSHRASLYNSDRPSAPISTYHTQCPTDSHRRHTLSARSRLSACRSCIKSPCHGSDRHAAVRLVPMRHSGS